MTDPAEKITAAEIKAALRRHFAAPAYQVFFEVGNDTGARVRRHADAVVVGIWPSTGHLVHGLEIKVSRSDFLNEMKKPEKSQPIYKHCHRWSLVVPSGLVKASELPPTWGLLNYSQGTFRQAAIPEKLEPEPITPGFMAALVRRAGEMDGEIVAQAVKDAQAVWNKDVDARIEREWQNRSNAMRREGEEAIQIVAGLKAALGDDLSSYNVEEFAAIIRCVRDAGIMRTWGGLLNLTESLDTIRASLSEAIEKAGLVLPERVRPADEMRKRAKRRG